MTIDSAARPRPKLFWVLAAVLAALSVLSACDDLLYPYGLISPRENGLSSAFLCMGILLGGATGYLAGEHFYEGPRPTGSPLWRNMIFAGLFAISTALLLQKLADRVAELYTFSYGVVRPERFEYPVKTFSVHGGAPRVDLDPFGTGGIEMLVSERDLEILRANRASDHPISLCYRGLQQRINNAVRVLRTGNSGSARPDAVYPCAVPLR